MSSKSVVLFANPPSNKLLCRTTPNRSTLKPLQTSRILEGQNIYQLKGSWNIQSSRYYVDIEAAWLKYSDPSLSTLSRTPQYTTKCQTRTHSFVRRQNLQVQRSYIRSLPVHEVAARRGGISSGQKLPVIFRTLSCCFFENLASSCSLSAVFALVSR